MDIDKFYRLMGATVKHVWNRLLLRPVKNFNVENRSQKAIETPKAAPWHETTQKLFDQIKKEGHFQELDKRNDNLLDRLKSVKVNAPVNDIVENTNDKELKKKLPQERFGADLPYVFYKPEKMPFGKITVLDALEMMINRNKLNLQSKELAEQYNLTEEDVDKLIQYIDIFKAINKEHKEIPLFVMDRDIDQIEEGVSHHILKAKREEWLKSRDKNQ